MNTKKSETTTYEEACEAYFEWATNQLGDPQQPSKSLSEEYYGIWHLENINGPLAAVTRAKEVVPVGEFYAAYERLAEEGKCDGAGGMEYRRVLAEWIVDQSEDLDEFIHRRANVGPDGKSLLSGAHVLEEL